MKSSLVTCVLMGSLSGTAPPVPHPQITALEETLSENHDVSVSPF